MESKKLTIFFTSDLHAYIYPTDYRSREERNIGLFKCASRFTRDGNTLIIDGGDLLQGSPLGAFCHDTLQNATAPPSSTTSWILILCSWNQWTILTAPGPLISS